MVEICPMKAKENSMNCNEEVGSVGIPNMMFGKSRWWIGDL